MANSTKETTYRIPLAVLYLRDWEDFGEKDLPAYFENAYAMFLRRLDLMRRLERPLGEEEEKELRFMLDALIEAKHAWPFHFRSATSP